MKQYDVRNDLNDHFYQSGINQQYALNVSGNSDRVNYYFSGGYDKNRQSLVGANTDRLSLRTQNEFKVTKDLIISVGLNYVQNNNTSGSNTGIGFQSGLRNIIRTPNWWEKKEKHYQYTWINIEKSS